MEQMSIPSVLPGMSDIPGRKQTIDILPYEFHDSWG